MPTLIRSIGSLLLPFLLCAASVCHAQIAVSPQILDVDLDDPQQTYAFRLYNYTSDDKHVRVSLANWTFDEDNKVVNLAPTETSLDHWTIINPLEFEIPQGKSQAVRLSIRPAIALPPGEHRLMVYFDELPPKDKSKEAPATLRVRFRIGAAVYAHVGPITRGGTLGTVSADRKGFRIGVTTTGNATTRFDGQYVVYPAAAWPGAGKVPAIERPDLPDMKLPPGAIGGGRLPNTAVLPGTTRTIIGEYAGKPPGKGRYIVDFGGYFGETAIVTHAEFDGGR